MQKLIAVLLSSVSLAGVAAYAQTQSADAPAWAAEAQMNPDYDGPVPTLSDAAQSETPPAAEGPSDAPAETPAWAAEATMNPAYTPDAAQSPAPAEEPVATEAATAPSAETPAWAAEATMNPDYQADAPSQPAATETATEPPAEPQPAAADAAPAKSEPGATQFYGTSEPTERPAWAADAAMNPDYAATSPAEEGPSAARQQQIEACRDALNGEIRAAKLMFGSGKWDILPVSYKALDKIAQIAKDCGDVVIEVDGHTDNQGKPESNVTISQLRAEAVVKYLTRAGVDAAKLKAVGHGQTKPVASNDSAEGRRQNRRIEFLVWGKGPPS